MAYPLVFLLLWTSVNAIDWNNITASQLGALPNSAFQTINSTQLASIPEASCTGFSSQQIGSIATAAVRIFSGYV
jgi:hypothetical protein